MFTKGTTGTMGTVKIRLNDDENKKKWRYICNQIDPDASYEEIVVALHDYFKEDEDRFASVERAWKGPEFR